MPPAPKPTKQPKGKKRQRVLIHYDCGCWEMTFRTSAVAGCKVHLGDVVKMYGLGLKYITEYSALVDILDDLASRITRRRDGHVCVLCGEHGSDCGHVFVRSKWAIRWDFANLHALCKTCNKKDSLPMFSHLYKDWYRAQYGEAQYEALKERADSRPAQGGKDWSVTELRELVLKLEDMLDRLEHMSLIDAPALRQMGYYGELGASC